jgi:hypothetical protein
MSSRERSAVTLARRAAIAWVQILSWCSFACGAEVEQPAPPVVEPAGTGPLDALSRRFGQVRDRMSEHGYPDEVGLARIFVLEEEGLVVPMDLATERCTTIVALGGGTIRSLHLSVYDGEGVEVGADPSRREGVLVHVCPPSAPGSPVIAPYYLVFEASEGSGAIVAGAFASKRGEGAGFEGLFEGLLSPEVPFRVVEDALAQTRTALRSRGFAPVGEPRYDSLAVGERLRQAAAFEPGRCFVAVARGDATVSDIDVALYDPRGAEVAQDLGEGAEPRLEFCPETRGQYVFEARVFDGAGAVGLMVLSAEAVAENGGTSDVSPVSADAPAGAAPDAVLSGLVLPLATRGYGAPVFVEADGRLGAGETKTHELVLGPGCFVIFGTGQTADTDLDLYLTDGEGAVLDRDASVQPVARVRSCFAEPTAVRVAVKAYGRAGRYAVAYMAAPPEILDVRALRFEEVAGPLGDRHFVRRAAEERLLEEDERWTRRVAVEAGTCVAWVAAGDARIDDLDLFVRSLDGTLVAASTGPEPFATVRRCVAETDVREELDVEVFVYRGDGMVTWGELESAP